MSVWATAFTSSHGGPIFRRANAGIPFVTFRAEGFPGCTLDRSSALDADRPSAPAFVVREVGTDAVGHHPNEGAIMRLFILGLMRERYPKHRKAMEHSLEILIADLAGVMQTVKSLCTISVGIW
jgi:hypothetical protein